jgi:hypothetical protein
MILLSHVRQCFSRTSKRSARRRPPHPLRRTESDRDLPYLIRTSLRFSAQDNQNAGSACRLHRRQPVARSQDLFSPLRLFQRRLAVVGSVGHLVAKDRGGLPRQRRSWQGPPAGRAQSRIPGALLAAVATGRCGCGVGHHPSGRLPADRSHRHCRPGEVQPPQLSSQAGGISPCCFGTWHSLSSCCPGSADLRAGAAGRSHLPWRRRFASRLLASPASQTAGQSMRQRASIWGHPRTLLTATAALPGMPGDH